MKKRNTYLFIFFLVLILVFLVILNYYKDSPYLNILNSSAVLSLSVFLIIFVVLLFVYREIENDITLKQFITIVTHKIKTPLTGIRWTIDMLQKDLTLLEKKDLLVEMQKANERLMEITDLLVGFAKFDKKLDYTLEDFSLREIVDTSYNKNLAIIKNKNIKFSIDSEKELPLVMIDKSRIQFAVDMLIDNAIKYTPKDGSISVSFKVDKKNIILMIKDTGIGMSYFDSRKVFKNFFRAPNAKLVDADGLGLGLYTTRKIVEHHKGKVWAESEGLGKGSTFYIQLPIKR